MLDMFVATRLNSNCTVYYEEFKSKEIRAFEKQNFVKGFPVPDMPISEYSDSTGSYKVFWRNLSSYYKRPAFDGYNSFQIRNYELLKDNHYSFFKEIIKNKLFYFADTAINKFDSITALTQGRPGMAFIEDDFLDIKVNPLTKKEVKIISFSPKKIAISTECNDSALLVFMQNYNKGWMATINNSTTIIHRTNLTMSSIIVPPGKSEITFIYKPQPVIVARYISHVALLCALFFLIFIRYKKHKF